MPISDVAAGQPRDEGVATVVIARQRQHRQIAAGDDLAEPGVVLWPAVLRQIAGEDDEIGRRIERRHPGQHRAERRRRIVGAGGRGDVRVGDLGDAHAAPQAIRTPGGGQPMNTASSGGKPLKPTEE